MPAAPDVPGPRDLEGVTPEAVKKALIQLSCAKKYKEDGKSAIRAPCCACTEFFYGEYNADNAYNFCDIRKFAFQKRRLPRSSGKVFQGTKMSSAGQQGQRYPDCRTSMQGQMISLACHFLGTRN